MYSCLLAGLVYKCILIFYLSCQYQSYHRLKIDLVLQFRSICFDAPINVIPGGGGAGGGGDFDILSKMFVKNHSPGTTYFVKKHKNPHPMAGELCQMFY